MLSSPMVMTAWPAWARLIKELLGESRVHGVGVGEVLNARDPHLHDRVSKEGIVGGDDEIANPSEH